MFISCSPYVIIFLTKYKKNSNYFQRITRDIVKKILQIYKYIKEKLNRFDLKTSFSSRPRSNVNSKKELSK